MFVQPSGLLSGFVFLRIFAVFKNQNVSQTAELNIHRYLNLISIITYKDLKGHKKIQSKKKKIYILKQDNYITSPENTYMLYDSSFHSITSSAIPQKF